MPILISPSLTFCLLEFGNLSLEVLSSVSAEYSLNIHVNLRLKTEDSLNPRNLISSAVIVNHISLIYS